MQNALITKVVGKVHISDAKTGEVILDNFNSVHPRNMALAIARGLAHSTKSSSIFRLALGNGGTHLSSNSLVYMTPNTTAVPGSLYHETWAEVIDDNDVVGGHWVNTNSLVTQLHSWDATAGNYVAEAQGPGISSTITCVMHLTADEPAGQRTSDGAITTNDSTFNPDLVNPANPEDAANYATSSPYVFDELGLFLNGDPTAVTSDDKPMLLTHIVFSPIEKSSNRELIITYTLTITVS